MAWWFQGLLPNIGGADNNQENEQHDNQRKVKTVIHNQSTPL
jgi:hypothetical protein